MSVLAEAEAVAARARDLALLARWADLLTKHGTEKARDLLTEDELDALLEIYGHAATPWCTHLAPDVMTQARRLAQRREP